MTSASITWVENKRFVAQADSGHALILDTDTQAGPALGPGPMEVMLMGVLGCTAMDVIGVLKKKRQPVTGLKVWATTERAADHPQRFLKIHLEYVAYGAVDPAALARAVQLSEEKYCPAIASLREPVALTSHHRVAAADEDAR